MAPCSLLLWFKLLYIVEQNLSQCIHLLHNDLLYYPGGNGFKVIYIIELSFT
jgi:hypothetical protein